MSGPLHVLIIEDSVDDTSFIVRELERGGFQVAFKRVDTAAAMRAALQRNAWQLIISDYSLPQFSATAALTLYQQQGLDIPFIVLSGVIRAERAVEIVKAGAHNYVMKDHLTRLLPVVRQELEASRDRSICRRTEAATAYLASLVESCDDAIIGETLTGMVVSWNVGATRLYGYAGEEMLGRSVATLIPGERPDELPEILAKIQNGQDVEPFETVRLRKDSTKVSVSLRISPVKDNYGHIIGASSVARDMTQRQQEEAERLALIQDLSSALACVGRLESVQGPAQA